MAKLFGKTPSAPAPPPVPTLADTTQSAAEQNSALNARAVGNQQTVLTTGLTNPSVRKGSTLLGGTS